MYVMMNNKKKKLPLPSFDKVIVCYKTKLENFE